MKAEKPLAGTQVRLLSSGEREGSFSELLASLRITGPWFAPMIEWFSGLTWHWLLVSGQ